MARFIQALVFVFSIATVAFAAKSWSFSDATLAVGPKGKEASSSFTFDASSPVEDTLEFSSSDTLRLTLTANEGGKAARPHQLFILIEDASANLDVAIPVSVKPSGKAKLDLDHRDLPPQLLYADSLKLTLLIASFGDSTPSKVEFASVKPIIDDSSPAKPQPPERWAPKPEITHTFRQPQKLPNTALSAIFAIAVTAGLPLFFMLLFFFASADVSSLTTALSNAPIAHVTFVISLIFFEFRFYKYWVNGSLEQILAESVVIATVAFLSGRRALGEVMQRRFVKV